MTQAHMRFTKERVLYRGWTAAGSGVWAAFGLQPTDGLGLLAEWANSVSETGARSITMWNLALDEKGTPYIGHRDRTRGHHYGPSTGVVVGRMARTK